MSYPIRSNECERLKALHDLRILDAEPQPGLDRICEMARDLFDVPIALVCLLDQNRQFYRAKRGIEIDGTPRELAFCNYTILGDEPLIVSDTSEDERFVSHPQVVGDPFIRFYAGAPLALKPGLHIGTLCIVDNKPRQLSAREHKLLRQLSDATVSELRLYEAGNRARDEAELAIAKSEERLRLAIEATGLGIWDLDVGSDTREWSPELKSVLGLSPDAPIGREVFLERVHPDDRGWVETHFYRDIAQVERGRYDSLFRVIRADNGEERWIAASARAFLDESGCPTRTIGTFRDITIQKSTEISLRAIEERFRNIASTSPDAFICMNAAGQITFWNCAAERIFGYASYEALGRSVEILFPERLRSGQREGFTPAFGAAASRREGQTIELIARHRSGYEIPVEMSVSTWLEGEQPGFGAVIRDTTERKRQADHLFRLAHYDGLTELPNRGLLWQRISAVLEDEEPAVLLSIDLDGFKEVNDGLGHAAGDEVLRQVARRLQDVAPTGAVISRVGGDEFMLLVPRTGDPLRASHVAGCVHACLAAPIFVETQSVFVECSIGIAIAPAHGSTTETLMVSGDLALYRAKQDGRQTTRLFTHELRQHFHARKSLEEELRRAFQKGEFELHFQPQVTLPDRTIVGAEALLRWRHPERGLLPPAAFLPVLAASSIASAVGEWTIAEACRQAAALRAAGHPIRMAVNLFSAQLREGSLANTVRQILDRTGLPAELLELEITEDIILKNEDVILQTLRQLRSLRVGIAFDDYGTGYASLSMLKRFPLTKLKIDKGFVRSLESGEGDLAIIDAVVRLGRSFGLSVIAEGIETEMHETTLVAVGCREGQGFFYSKPIPAYKLMQLLANEDTRIAVQSPLHVAS
jgi:diguanylate cyclase (GGDEF)-like protein/PAS domain S-box-containing protein